MASGLFTSVAIEAGGGELRERERERTTCTKVRRVHKAGIPGGGSKEEDYGEQRPRFPHVRLMDAYAGRL